MNKINQTKKNINKNCSSTCCETFTAGESHLLCKISTLKTFHFASVRYKVFLMSLKIALDAITNQLVVTNS